MALWAIVYRSSKTLASTPIAVGVTCRRESAKLQNQADFEETKRVRDNASKVVVNVKSSQTGNRSY
jgi:hypothetical protein